MLFQKQQDGTNQSNGDGSYSEFGMNVMRISFQGSVNLPKTSSVCQTPAIHPLARLSKTRSEHYDAPKVLPVFKQPYVRSYNIEDQIKKNIVNPMDLVEGKWALNRTNFKDPQNCLVSFRQSRRKDIGVLGWCMTDSYFLKNIIYHRNEN